MVLNSRRVNHSLNVRVRRDTGFYLLVVHSLGGVQVVFGAQSLEKFENLLIYNFRYSVTFVKRYSSFSKSLGLKCKRLSITFR